MRQQLVYDTPTRIFHWLFAALFLTAFAIGKTVDDESPLYAYHMLAGLTLVFTLMLRLVWGFVGSRHSQFKNFALKPSSLVIYFKSILSGEKRVWSGHNPASSWAALLMFAFTLGLGVTGYLMTSSPGEKDAIKEIHEFFAHGFIVIVILHVAGVILHTLRHKDMIGLSMIDGKKANVANAEAITTSHHGVGVLLAGLVVVFGMHLFHNFDANTKTLHLFGTTLQLGENEGDEREGGANAVESEGHKKANDADEDDDGD